MLVAGAFVAGFLVVGATGASAAPTQGPGEEPCNEPPYGCPPTSPEPGVELECPTLDPRRGPPGTQVIATVTGVDPPNSTVTILFDGSPVASGTASGDTAQISFTVPASAGNGPHTVTAVAANGSAECGPGGSGFTVNGSGGGNDAQVLGAEFERDESSARSGGGVLGGGSLARTGITIGAFLAAAAVLILVGRALLEQGRRRRSAG